MSKISLLSMVLAVLMFCSCVGGRDKIEPLPINTAEPPAVQQDGKPVGFFNAQLYYVSNESRVLLPTTVRIDAIKNVSLIGTLISRLYVSMDSSTSSCLPNTVFYQDAMVSNNVANVNFTGAISKDPFVMLTFSAGITASLCKTFGYSAVNIFLNDEPIYLLDMPLGTTFPIEGSLSSYIEKTVAIYNKDSNESVNLDTFVTLYLPVPNYDYLLMNYMEFGFSRNEPLKNNISDLLKLLMGKMKGNYPTISALLGEPTFSLGENGENRLELSFLTSKKTFDENLFAYAITLTLTGYFKDIDSVLIKFSDGIRTWEVNSGTPLTMRSCRFSVANKVTLSYPSYTALSLENADAFIRFDKSRNLSVIIEEMLKKTFYKDAVYPNFDGKELIDAYVNNGIAVLNFDLTFYSAIDEYIQQGTDEAGKQNRERLIIYSIVNTITDIDYINSVWFLCDGKKLNKILYISLENPLMRNVGLLVENG
ncbi:MAG: GerMN domain-containing protein [Clostridia bacterium]